MASWIGKVGGGLLGFVAGGPVGAVIGAVLGHQYDLGLTPRPSVRRGYEGMDSSGDTRQRAFFEATFLVMGHLAKVDGRVSEAEIQVARQTMRRMHLRPADARRAIELFNTGKRPDFPVDAQVDRLRRFCAGQPELLRAFLELQLDIVLVKDGVTAPERELLVRMAERLGVSRLELAQLEAIARARRSFGQQRTRQVDDVQKAYESLGIAADASDEDVKKAYRRLMNQHHPDKQAARGLPENMLELAKERTREIRSAYELIRDRRGMK